MMDLIRRPSSTLGLSTFEEMDKLFDNFWRSFSPAGTAPSLTSLSIYSSDDNNMVVEVEAPGYDQDDIDINVRDNVLEISGSRQDKQEQRDKKRNYMVRESASSFARRVVLPEGADTGKISAELDRGILKVTVPVERPEARRIKINSGKNSGAKKLAANSK